MNLATRLTANAISCLVVIIGMGEEDEEACGVIGEDEMEEVSPIVIEGPVVCSAVYIMGEISPADLIESVDEMGESGGKG